MQQSECYQKYFKWNVVYTHTYIHAGICGCVCAEHVKMKKIKQEGNKTYGRGRKKKLKRNW